MNEKIEFDYFMKLFRLKFNEKAYLIGMEKMDKETFYECLSLGDLYATFPLNEERLSIYEEILLEICKRYMQLTNAFIENSDNPYLLVNQILNTITDNPYRNSFIWFINMFFRDNMYFLGRGTPLLMYSLGSLETKQFEITLDANYQIRKCEAINMNKVEEAKTMMRILSLEKNNQIGPIQNVEYIYRKDI